jgi:hypothetical protein
MLPPELQTVEPGCTQMLQKRPLGIRRRTPHVPCAIEGYGR